MQKEVSVDESKQKLTKVVSLDKKWRKIYQSYHSPQGLDQVALIHRASLFDFGNEAFSSRCKSDGLTEIIYVLSDTK